MNNIFFMGSGFSKAICDNYPTLGDLSLAVKKYYKSESFSGLTEIKTHIDNLPFYMVSNYEKYDQSDNIESILTYLLQKLPYKNSILNYLDLACYHDILLFIGNYFSSLKNNLNQNANCDNILKHIIDKRTPCITLNYDTLLEDLLIKFCKDHNEYDLIDNRCFYPYLKSNNNGSLGYTLVSELSGDYKDRGYMNKELIPNIIKLHGSLNWEINNSNQIVLKSQNNNKQPFIVPPVLDKSNIYNDGLNDIWLLGYDAIKNAKNIFIFGFSFPMTDLSIKYLFQSALKENKNAPNIYVINIYSDELKKHYDELFAGFGNLIYDFCNDNPLKKFNEEIISID